MHKDLEKVLYTEAEIQAIVDRIAGQIRQDYEGQEPVLICVLKGSVMFFADLARKLGMDCTIDFMAASSYGSSTQSSGTVKITKDITTDITGKHVLIVEDILDTGNTLSYIKEYLSARSALSVKLCALFDKPDRRKKPITADYAGETIDDLFIVGYGLDYDEHYRNLPYVGVLKPEIYQKSK